MHYIDKSKGKFEDIFTKPFGSHGMQKVGFGENRDSVHNPTSVCVEYDSGGRLLEVADWSDGSSHQGASMGGDRNIVVATVPYAIEGDTPEAAILGVLRYRQGQQPSLYVNGKPVDGGASRFTSFVSETGAADEDPKPQKVSDLAGQREVNRKTGHGAHRTYFVHEYRIGVVEGEAYAALTLQHNGHNPKTDTVYPEPEVRAEFCSNCGAAV